MQQEYNFKIVKFVKKKCTFAQLIPFIVPKSPFRLHLSFLNYNKKFITLYKNGYLLLAAPYISYSISQKVVQSNSRNQIRFKKVHRQTSNLQYKYLDTLENVPSPSYLI